MCFWKHPRAETISYWDIPILNPIRREMMERNSILHKFFFEDKICVSCLEEAIVEKAIRNNSDEVKRKRTEEIVARLTTMFRS